MSDDQGSLEDELSRRIRWMLRKYGTQTIEDRQLVTRVKVGRLLLKDIDGALSVLDMGRSWKYRAIFIEDEGIRKAAATSELKGLLVTLRQQMVLDELADV